MLQELLEQAKQSAQRGMYNSAIDYLHQALQEEPNSAEAHYYLAGVYFKQKELKSAKTHLKKALRLQPDYDKALALRDRLEKEGKSQNNKKSASSSKSIKDEEDDFPGLPLSSPQYMARLLLYGFLFFSVVFYIVLIIYAEPVQGKYNEILSNLYHYFDIPEEENITGKYQLSHIITGILGLMIVAGTLIIPFICISYLVSYTCYAIRFNQYTTDIKDYRYLGFLPVLLVYILILPWFVFIVLTLVKLIGTKIWFGAAAIVIFAITQMYDVIFNEVTPVKK